MKMNSENIPPSSKENVSSQQSTRTEMPSKTQHNQKIGINKIGQLQRFRMNIPYYIALITTKRRTIPYIIVVGCIGVVALNTLILHYIYGPGHPITWFRFHLMKQKGLLTEEQLWKEKIMKETYFIRAKTSQFNQKFDNDMSITRVP